MLVFQFSTLFNIFLRGSYVYEVPMFIRLLCLWGSYVRGSYVYEAPMFEAPMFEALTSRRLLYLWGSYVRGSHDRGSYISGSHVQGAHSLDSSYDSHLLSSVLLTFEASSGKELKFTDCEYFIIIFLDTCIIVCFALSSKPFSWNVTTQNSSTDWDSSYQFLIRVLNIFKYFIC